MKLNKKLATLAATGAVAIGGAVSAAPASAQAPVVTGGLVNVTIVDTDILTNNDTVISALNGVTLQVAAQICGVSVTALAVDLAPDGIAVCRSTQDSDSTTTTTVTQRRRR